MQRNSHFPIGTSPRISKKINCSLKGATGERSTSKAPGRTRKGKATDIQAESRASSGIGIDSGKGIFPGSEYQKTISSSSKRRVNPPVPARKVTSDFPITNLPRSMSRHPHNVPIQKTNTSSSASLRKINSASSPDISLTAPPWVHRFIGWFANKVNRAMKSKDSRIMTKLKS